jgi:uncharacterized HAD superfamily protein
MMSEEIEIAFPQSIIDDLVAFSSILHKDVNSMVQEAVEEYLAKEQQKLMEQSLYDDNAMTNLDYNEFWDGIDV